MVCLFINCQSCDNSTIKPVLKINGVEIVVKPVENKNDESIATFVVDGDVHIELSSK